MQPLVNSNGRVNESAVGERASDWPCRGRLLSFAMLIAALIYVAHYPHDSVEVLQGTARYLVAWLLLACGIALLSYPAVQRVDRWLDWLCVSFAGLMTFSLFAQSSQVNLRLGVNELGWWWATAALIPLARRVAAYRDAAWFLFRASVAVVVAQAFIGWHQVLFDLPDLITQYREEPDRLLRQFGIPSDQVSAMRVRFENRLFDGGPTGTFALTNSLAALLTGGVVAMLAWIGRGSTRFFKSAQARLGKWQWGIWALALLVVVTILLATASRSAVAALLIVGGIAMGQWGIRSRGFVWVKQRPAVLASLALGGLGVMVAAVYAFRSSEFVSQAPASLTIRLNYWRACGKMLAQHPWGGIGPGQFRMLYEQFRHEASNEQIADPHQFLLQVAAAGGLPVLILFVAILAMLVWRSSYGRWTNEPMVEVQTFESNESSGQLNSQLRTVAWIAVVLTIVVAWLGGLITNQLPAVRALFVGSVAAVLFSRWAWLGGQNVDEDGVCWSWERQVAGWASVAILLDLLASGGISVPGISIALWCWVGVAQPVRWLADSSSMETSAGIRDRGIVGSSHFAKRHRGQWMLPAWVTNALVVWYFIGIRPVESANLAYNRYLNLVAGRVNPAAAEALQDGLEADPWNAELAIELAAAYCHLGQLQPTSAEHWNRQWQAAEQRAISLAGQDAVAMMRLGDLRLERYWFTGDPAMLQAASGLYEQATLRSPSHETYAAQWAEVLRAMDDPRARDVALKAMKLSESGGYYERSLPFTMIRPAASRDISTAGSDAGRRSGNGLLRPADELLAPLLPHK